MSEMDKRSPLAVIATALVLCVIGLLNAALGVLAVIAGAFPSAEGSLVTPPIGVGSIFFGLLLLVAGVLWVVSGAGYFTRKKWASPLALYTAPAIGVINLAGVLHLWGFSVIIGYAAVSAVAAMGSIWYISKKELASFFLIAVVEHLGVILIFSMLIYAEPVDIAESQDRELLIDIEVIEPPEPVPPEIVPQKKAVLKKQPILPRIEIRDVTATDPGTELEGSVPQLPKTVARIKDTGSNIILRSSGLKDREQQYQDTVPALSVESALKSSKKPSLEIGPSEKTKDTPEATVARLPSPRDESLSPDERLGPSDEVAKPSFAGDISGEIAGRRVVSWPKLPEGYKGTGGGSAIIKFWVDPAGSVTRVELSTKSGSPRLDTLAMEYVKQIRFVALPKSVKHRVQWGKIPIDFELTRKPG